MERDKQPIFTQLTTPCCEVTVKPVHRQGVRPYQQSHFVKL